MAEDPAAALLISLLHQSAEPTLVVADEHFANVKALPGAPHIHYLTNRYDVARDLREAGARVSYSDFDFKALDTGRFRLLLFRLAKEKALVHHVIASAPEVLDRGGELCLIGHKNEGLKTYGAKAAGLLGGEQRRIRGNKGFHGIAVTRSDQMGTAPDTLDYTVPRLAVEEDGNGFYSKPGIYGWQKVDAGSALLMKAVENELEESGAQQAAKVLDLGCGYGYLGVRAWQLTGAAITATDNNFAAVTLCQRNFAYHGVNGTVVADDCGQGLGDSFDIVLCNPPFHQGFATRGDLTERFLRAAAQHLAEGGKAYFVVNTFIDLPARAAPFFVRCQRLAQGDGFSVYRLEQAPGPATDQDAR